MQKYKLNQILYVLTAKLQIFPVKVVEIVMKQTSHGVVCKYNVITQDDFEEAVPLDSLTGKIFTDLSQAKNAILTSMSMLVGDMITKCSEIAQSFPANQDEEPIKEQIVTSEVQQVVPKQQDNNGIQMPSDEEIERKLAEAHQMALEYKLKQG